MTSDVKQPGRLCPQHPEQRASTRPGACPHWRATVLVMCPGICPLPSDATPSAEQEEKPRGGREWLVWVSVAPNALVMQKTGTIA